MRRTHSQRSIGSRVHLPDLEKPCGMNERICCTSELLQKQERESESRTGYPISGLRDEALLRPFSVFVPRSFHMEIFGHNPIICRLRALINLSTRCASPPRARSRSRQGNGQPASPRNEIKHASKPWSTAGKIITFN